MEHPSVAGFVVVVLVCVRACVLFGALLAALILIVAQSKYLTCISLVYLAENSVYHALV